MTADTLGAAHDRHLPSAAVGHEAMSRRTTLIEAAIDAGLLDLAATAIAALDAAAVDPDLEREEDGDGRTECLPMVCACCNGRGRFDPELIA